jgi:hypothetical protein
MEDKMQWRLSKNGVFTVWSFYGGIKRLCSLRFSLEGSLEGQCSYPMNISVFAWMAISFFFFFLGGGGGGGWGRSTYYGEFLSGHA